MRDEPDGRDVGLVVVVHVRDGVVDAARAAVHHLTHGLVDDEAAQLAAWVLNTAS